MDRPDEHRARERSAALVTAALREGEVLETSGKCWAANRRDRHPLLLLGRHQYDVALTDRRLLLLVAGKRRQRHLGVGADGVAMEHELARLGLDRVRAGIPLLQLLVTLPTARVLVLEFRPRHRALGRRIADSLGAARPTPT